MLQTLLASIPINVLEYGYEIGLNWLGKFAQVIIEGVGVIGFGIIVFTIVLKAITLPFDIYQRISMRKQNLVMKSMQPELEKLQKQYANDKTTYNQKMMELYKKNGYSMLGACLPMILSLVILIVAFQGFRTYSQYANLAMYEDMSRAYSEEILKYAPEVADFGEGRNYFILAGEGEEENLKEGKLVWKEDTISGTEIGLSEDVSVRLYTEGDKKTVETTSSDPDKFVSYSYWIEEENVKFSYKVNSEKFDAYFEANKDKPFDANAKPTEGENGETVAPPTMEEVYKSVKESVVADGISEEDDKKDGVTTGRFVARMGATAAANWYRAGNDSHFLWVKNVWYPDVAYEHPIQKQYSKLKSQLNNNVTLKDGRKVALSAVLGQDAYEDLTSCLTEEKSQPNGYFILIILSIGLMVLSQFVSMRSSKESNKYQTVDGQGAKTQKMMLIIMPVMYAIFAFMYSAAFSIYMTMSSLISLLTTLLANLIIGRVFKKKEQVEEKEKISYKYAWQMTEKEKRAKEKQAKKEAKMQE
ncbi:MAG: YidC/Oxa1 family membrane protein insertase, partial [Clostridiales bacterium]|nr:YidC/Oxa1 family membrane protein insertase [Clostridiales bacterium]